MTEQTPYDTGTRLEPVPWVTRIGDEFITGTESLRPAEPDDFGRVDFDDEEGVTMMCIHVRFTAGEYVVVIDEISDAYPIRVQGPQ